MADQWEPIGRTTNQVILYHRPSHGLSVRSYRQDPVSITSLPGTPPAQSRTASTTNLPVLSRTRRDNRTPGNVTLGRRSSALVARRNSPVESASVIPPSGLCPYCYRPMAEEDHGLAFDDNYDDVRQTTPNMGMSSAHVLPIFSNEIESADDSMVRGNNREWDQEHHNLTAEAGDSGLLHVRPYFQILERSVDGSRASTPVQGHDVSDSQDDSEGYSRDSATPNGAPQQTRSIEGYYHRFFIEEKRLGMGAEGSVYLCQHVLDGNYLGHYAIKKVAVGDSKPYLYKILQEVRLLEQLRHPNIIPYHHVWIEDSQFSSFAPPIATLHVLMSYANAGNLDDFIKSRCSTAGDDLSINPIDREEEISAEELKRRIRERRKSARSASEAGAKAVFTNGGVGQPVRRRSGDVRAVMLLGTEEIASLFGDVVNGLHFLHSNGILHLDLKCSNVLLHNRDGELIPRAMISDFGTSEEMLHRKRDRTGHTGTMEYMAPETISPDSNGHWREWDTKADIWSLGLILHKLIFFRLPYGDTESYDELSAKIHQYSGFKASRETKTACEKRGLPLGLLSLLEEMTNVSPAKRPSIQKVVQKSTSLYSQADAHLSDISGSKAVVPARQLMRALRNPWRANTSDEAEERKIETVGPYESGSTGAEGVVALLAEIPTSKYIKSGVALLKLCTLLPPFRETLPPPSVMYLLITLILVDLQVGSLALSYTLNATHLVGLWWLVGH